MTDRRRGPGRPKKDGRYANLLLLHTTLERLAAEAQRQGIPRSEVVDRLVAEHLPTPTGE